MARIPVPNMLARGGFALLQHADQLQALKTVDAIDELLHHPVHDAFRARGRRAGRSFDQAGRRLVCRSRRPTRDPDSWADPDVLDLIRRAASLPSATASTNAWAALFDRFPNRRLAEPAEDVPITGLHDEFAGAGAGQAH